MMLSAREIAKLWRVQPNERPKVEAIITMDDRWSEFRFSRHGELIAKFTDADREQRENMRGADSYSRSDKALGIEQRCVAGMPGASL